MTSDRLSESARTYRNCARNKEIQQVRVSDWRWKNPTAIEGTSVVIVQKSFISCNGLKCILLRVVLIAMTLLAALPAYADTKVFVGTFGVYDSDILLKSHFNRLRIIGIDACEPLQWVTQNGKNVDCGWMARDWMSKHIFGKYVRCEAQEKDRFGRWLATCSIKGEDIGAAMIREGMAVIDRSQAKVAVPDYLPLEDEARKAKRGMWATEFEMPWEWRKKN